jgi:hypothetical protein
MFYRCVDLVAGNAFAKKHDVGLEHAVAVAAGRHDEKVPGVKVGVAVLRIGGIQGEPVGVQPTEFVLQVVACRLAPAPHAPDKIKPATQVDDATISGGLMQSIAGVQVTAAIRLYMAMHGDTVAGKKIEV